MQFIWDTVNLKVSNVVSLKRGHQKSEKSTALTFWSSDCPREQGHLTFSSWQYLERNQYQH